MNYKFTELVDMSRLHTLLQSLYLATGIPSGIIGVDGEIILAVGWQKICQEFHRKNIHTEKLCRQSDDYIKQQLESAKPYVSYTCDNGLVDAAAPIIIDGVHVATIFQGQFLFEKPDRAFFEQQAERYGFNKEEYFAVLDQVPIYSRDKLSHIMNFLLEFAKMLADLGVSRLRQIEQQTKELQESEDQIFKIFSNMPDVAIKAFNEDGQIVFWNIASEKLYGYKMDEIMGQSLNSTLFEGAEGQRFRSAFQKVCLTQTIHGPEEWKVKHRDGSEKYVYATLIPIKQSSGKIRIICMHVDITEKKQLEAEMVRLDRLNMIGEMAASIGHEVRNPMTTVRGYLQLFQQKQGFAKYNKQFATMIEELDRANNIISEFLSLAKNKTIEMKLGNLNDVIHTLYPLVQADAIRRGHEIHLETGTIPDHYFDEKEIRQLILNLVRNGLEALKQTGSVHIHTYLDQGGINLAVSDTGSGIPADILAKLGTPFITTKENGTGLGLPVCFRVAQRHGAKIAIDTGPSGTTFNIRFPVALRTSN